MPNARVREESIAGPGGLRLFLRSWRPEGPTRGVVVIVPGVNSHSGYYLWAGDQFVANGLAVYAIDLHGRGKSDGERFYLERMEDYVEDVHTVVRLAKSREPGLPVFLLGHSAGGVVSGVYALEHPQELAGFICESFAFELPAPNILINALKGISRVAPHLGVLRLKNRDFSRDPLVVEAMDHDPLIAHETQPSQTVAELARADDRLRREFPKFTVPLLILHGTADKATKPSGSRLFYERAGSADKTLKLYEGHAHDLLSDLEREVVMNDIVEWIEHRLAPPPPREYAFPEVRA